MIFTHSALWAGSVIESQCPSIYLFVYMSPPSLFFLCLSMALKLHDQVKASHWSTPKPTPPPPRFVDPTRGPNLCTQLVHLTPGALKGFVPDLTHVEP